MVVTRAQLVAILLLVVVAGGLQALEICDMTEDGLMACKPSVTAPDPAEPTPECCKAVEGADMKCLCSYKDSTMLPSFGIDPILAVALPAKCSLPAPPC